FNIRRSAFTAPANNDPSAAHLHIVSPQYFFPVHPAPLIVRRHYRRLQCASPLPHVLTGSLSFCPGCCVTIAAPSPLKISSLGRHAQHYRKAT
ncbi:hypothetical protein HYPSUDRAFT_39848, partial [Hypholoma sublateritium FD-334 SS-4]